jgi:hypothetical protein
MSQPHRISRRTVLRGLGTAIALPFLECMLPVASLAAPSATTKAATRMAFFYVPNGINMAEWAPTAVGTDFTLPSILEPLKPFQKDLLVLSGLTCDKARPHGDGGGDHARAMAAFLTGTQPRKTGGSDLHTGVSVDQVAAQKVGKSTRFASLELGCEAGRQAGECDTGYACAYSSNLSWRTESSPMPKEVNPRLVFERLFSGPVKNEAEGARARREKYQLSILDFVLEDASQLKNRLGANDARKMEEYLTSVRDLEVRLTRAETGNVQAPPGATKPAGVPKDYQEHIRLLCDLLVLAFQGDLTRIATFVFADEGSNRSYRAIGVPEGHHDLSHHGGDKDKLEKIRQINRFHMSQFAYLLGKLQAIPEGERTLLDQCMLLYGSGNSDGNRHNHDDLPIVLAGKGGGTLKTGRHVKYPNETPLTNLFLSMLERMDAPIDRLGDSTGRLTNLAE